MDAFNPLISGALMILAAGGAEPVKVTDGCRMPRPAQISVVPRATELALDTSKTLAQIQNQDIDTINPYGYGVDTYTNGYTAGALKLTSQVKLDYAVDRNTGGYCLWYEAIGVDIEVSPTIVIAREVAQDACMSRAVYNHELKHVNVDRKIANQYARSMGDALYRGLESRGFMVGPLPAAAAEATAARMKQTVAQLLEMQSRRMDIDRQDAQQAIDSLEEYQRVKALCPDFRPPGEKRRR
jgi:hypothetical protein